MFSLEMCADMFSHFRLVPIVKGTDEAKLQRLKADKRKVEMEKEMSGQKIPKLKKSREDDRIDPTADGIDLSRPPGPPGPSPPLDRSLGKTDFSVLCIGDTSWENLQFQVEELARAVISLRSNFPEDLIISVFDSLSNSSIQGSMNQSCVESKHVNIGEDTKRSVNKVEIGELEVFNCSWFMPSTAMTS